MDNLDYMMFLDLSCYFNLWSCVLVILWLCYTILLIQGALSSLYSCYSIHTRPFFTWSIVLLFSLVFYLSVYITVRFIIPSFQYSTCIALLLSHIHFCVFSLFMCALAGPLLMDPDFSVSEFEEPMSHCSKEPREITKREFEVPFSYVFWYFVLL